jgi:hypothetical protein
MLTNKEYETMKEYQLNQRNIHLDAVIIASLRKRGLIDNCPCGLDNTCIARTAMTNCGKRAIRRYERYNNESRDT